MVDKLIFFLLGCGVMALFLLWELRPSGRLPGKMIALLPVKEDADPTLYKGWCRQFLEQWEQGDLVLLDIGLNDEARCRCELLAREEAWIFLWDEAELKNNLRF